MVNLRLEYKSRLQIIYYKMIKYLEHTLVTLQWLSADGASSVHRSDFLGKGNVAEEPSERERMVK